METDLPPGWSPYAVAGNAAGEVWTTLVEAPGLARVRPALRSEALPVGVMQLSFGADGSLWYTRTDGRLGRRAPAAPQPAAGAGSDVAVGPAPGAGSHSAVDPVADDAGSHPAADLAPAAGSHAVIDLAPGAAPYGIAAAPGGGAWFTAPGVNQLGRIIADGTIAMLDLPVPEARPAMLTIAPDGTPWVALNGAGALARVRGDAVDVVDLPSGRAPAAPVGVSAAPDGVWYADIAGGCVGRVGPAGGVEVIPFADPACRPHAVAADPDGGCWATLWGSGELARITAGCDVTVHALPGREPHGLWVSPTHVWVAMESGSLVAVAR